MGKFSSRITEEKRIRFSKAFNLYCLIIFQKLNFVQHYGEHLSCKDANTEYNHFKNFFFCQIDNQKTEIIVSDCISLLTGVKEQFSSSMTFASQSHAQHKLFSSLVSSPWFLTLRFCRVRKGNHDSIEKSLYLELGKGDSKPSVSPTSSVALDQFLILLELTFFCMENWYNQHCYSERLLHEDIHHT